MPVDRPLRIFVSAVTNQFRECRNALASDLRAVGAYAKEEQDFTQSGCGTLLQDLENYIASCDRVIYLVGDGYGTEPSPEAVPPEAPQRSYTQWEYYFALGERLDGSRAEPKQLFVYFASEKFRAAHPHGQGLEEVERQRRFEEAIRKSGRAWRPFGSLDELCRLVLRDGFRLPDKTVRRVIDSDADTQNPRPAPTQSSLEAKLQNVPLQVTSFVGRERELTELKKLLMKFRAITLTGIGGIGKTRLALQLALDLRDSYKNDVLLVELDSLFDPSLVPSMVASAFGLKEEPGKPITRLITEFIGDRQLLLLLDNCEHLLTACAKLVQTIFQFCPRVTILATSREGLGIGEANYPVPPLPVPAAKPKSLARAATFEAVQLFVERARLHQPQFTMTHRNVPAVLSICRRLDGIPLAIELAAARIRSLSPDEINQRLDHRFRLLSRVTRVVPVGAIGPDTSSAGERVWPYSAEDSPTPNERHRSLQAMLDWSYDLLSDPEQALLCRLSVFAGGWTLKAAHEVCNCHQRDDSETLDLLTSLVDKNLVIAVEGQGKTRYRLLETVREYAGERLLIFGARDQLRCRHMAYFLSFAEKHASRFRGVEQETCFAEIEEEYGNLRSALEWCTEGSVGSTDGRGETGLRLAAALWWFWYIRGYLSEGRSRLARALVLDAGDLASRAKAMNGAGVLAWAQGEHTAARDLYEQGLAVWRELGCDGGIATSLINLGIVAHEQRELAMARRLYEESLAIRRKMGDRRGIAGTLNNIGSVAREQADYVAAQSMLEESLAAFRDLRDRQGVATSLHNLGDVHRDRGQNTVAQDLFAESLALFFELGDRRGIAATLEALAAGDGNPRRAAQLWGAAARLRDELEAPLPPNVLGAYWEQVSKARAVLNDERAFETAWAAGRALGPDEAVQLTLNSARSGSPV